MTEEKKDKQKVNALTIYSPCNFKTSKGISIGDDFKKIEQAYKDYIDSETINQEEIIAGTIYGGVIFNFKNGKINRIFIGASAE